MKLTQNGKFLAKDVQPIIPKSTASVNFRKYRVRDVGDLELRLARPISANNSKLLEKNNSRRYAMTLSDGTIFSFDGLCMQVTPKLLEIAINSGIHTRLPKRKAKRKR